MINPNKQPNQLNHLMMKVMKRLIKLKNGKEKEKIKRIKNITNIEYKGTKMVLLEKEKEKRFNLQNILMKLVKKL